MDTAPRTARPAYVLAAVSLFVPILVTILLPEIALVLFFIVSLVATIGAITALVLGRLTIRAGRKEGRLDGIFGILLAVVAIAYNAPLLVRAILSF
jgi:hypothetical protein